MEYITLDLFKGVANFIISEFTVSYIICPQWPCPIFPNTSCFNRYKIWQILLA